MDETFTVWFQINSFLIMTSWRNSNVWKIFLASIGVFCIYVIQIQNSPNKTSIIPQSDTVKNEHVSSKGAEVGYDPKNL